VCVCVRARAPGKNELRQHSIIKDVPVNTAGYGERQGRNEDPNSIAVCQKMFLQISDLTLKGVRIITYKVREDSTGIFS
jgi:hypothetical protein